MIILLFLLALPPLTYILWDSFNLAVGRAAKRRSNKRDAVTAPSSKIAILYPTSDDFDESACETLLHQEAIDFDFFILDDSTQTNERTRVDAWASRQSRSITVVRREDRKGYKGGNINNWLQKFGDPKTYPYILLVDADEHLTVRFTETLLRRIEHTNYAFVQAVHYATAELTTTFQKVLHMQVTVDQLYQMPAWNLVGIVPLIGHGVILKTDALKKVGGFPDVVSEDLALTIRLAEIGLYGYVVSDVVGYEVFPRDYKSYWRRRRRWVEADTEMLRKFLPTIWQSKIKLLAKWYFTVREFRLPLLSSYWILCAMISSLAIAGASTELILSPWWWLVAPIVLIPSAPALLLKTRPFLQRVLYMTTIPILGLAASNITIPAVLVGIKGKLRFDATGSRAIQKVNMVNGWVLWDLLSGALFLTGGVLSGNGILVAVGLAVFFSPLLRTRAALPLFMAMKLAFWILIMATVITDVSYGSVPLEHLLLVVGLSFW